MGMRTMYYVHALCINTTHRICIYRSIKTSSVGFIPKILIELTFCNDRSSNVNPDHLLRYTVCSNPVGLRAFTQK